MSWTGLDDGAVVEACVGGKSRRLAGWFAREPLQSCTLSEAAPQSDAPITPWPLPADARRVLVVGGTFDPPHRAHIELADAYRQPGDEAILFVPAAQSPLKSGLSQTPTKHRVEMLRLAAAAVEWSAVWTDEVDRARASPGVPSFTIDTLRRMQKVAPGLELRMLIGSDQAAQFHKWREAREILKLARVVVAFRKPYESWESLEPVLRAANFWSDSEVDWWRHSSAEFGTRDIDPANSTEIRRAIGEHGARGVPTGWLHPNVAAYIERHRLYVGG